METEISQTSAIKDEFLLQCVSNYKPLYDKSDKGYKSLLQRENCWVSVARSVGCTVADAKARFKSLREKYRREIQIIEKLERSGAPASARPVWPLMSFFRFLYKCGEEAQRVTTSNYETPVQDADDLDEVDEENIIIQFEDPIEDPIEDERSNEGNTASASISRSGAKKKATKKSVLPETSKFKTELKQIDVLVDVSAAINNLNSTKVNADRYDIFAQYIASEVKNIGEPHSSILMEDIQLLIINYKRDLRSGNV